ncbi:MAG: hypothetical protein V2G41_10110 [bacterium JZ-2024 1]
MAIRRYTWFRERANDEELVCKLNEVEEMGGEVKWLERAGGIWDIVYRVSTKSSELAHEIIRTAITARRG